MRLSFVKGPHSISHNNRDFISKNVDRDRIDQNVTYVKESLEDAYRHLFQESIEIYNKGKKPSRRPYVDSDDYLKAMKHSNIGQNAFYEQVVQIGTMHDAGCGSEMAAITTEILDQYVKTFQERNPNLYLFNAVLHMDEKTPHLHLDYIPIKHSKRGLGVQNSLTGAFREMGIEEGTSKYDNSTMNWQKRERAYIRELCLQRGINLEQEVSTDRKSLSPEEYRVQAEIVENRVNEIIKHEMPKVERKRFGFSDNKDEVIEQLKAENANLRQYKHNHSEIAKNHSKAVQDLKDEYDSKLRELAIRECSINTQMQQLVNERTELQRSKSKLEQSVDERVNAKLNAKLQELESIQRNLERTKERTEQELAKAASLRGNIEYTIAHGYDYENCVNALQYVLARIPEEHAQQVIKDYGLHDMMKGSLDREQLRCMKPQDLCMDR